TSNGRADRKPASAVGGSPRVGIERLTSRRSEKSPPVPRGPQTRAHPIPGRTPLRASPPPIACWHASPFGCTRRTSLLREGTSSTATRTNATAIRVVLGDDSYLAREGITRALESIDDVELVASAADLDELSRLIEELDPDVVVTDIRMPPTHTDEGIRLATALRSSRPGVGV